MYKDMTIVVSAQAPYQHPHLPPVQAPPRPDHPAWVSDPASLKKIYDRVQQMWAKSKKPKAKRIAFEQEIIPFEKFERFEMTLCPMKIGKDPTQLEWAYYMGGTLPGKNSLNFVMRIFPDTSVFTGVPWGVYRSGSRLLEEGEMPVVVGAKRAREE